MKRFVEIWGVDFEFRAPDGERPLVRCMVARELRLGRELRMWADELVRHPQPPFNTGKDALFVAYYASAELTCFRALGWRSPYWILDLFTEYRNHTNGTIHGVKGKRGLLAALEFFSCRKMAHEEKTGWRDLVMEDRLNGDYSPEERQGILDYCATDVIALEDLLPRLVGTISNLDHALLRGRYMDAVAAMEWRGIPLDKLYLDRLLEHWEGIKLRLISEIDPQYGVYEGSTFKRDLFIDYLQRNNIPWPLTETGIPKLDTDTFRRMADAYPALTPLHELRYALGQLKLNRLSVGQDGRNRCLLSPFGSITGRNQPSTAKFVFGPSKWIRGLIKPPLGKSIAYVDFKSQEIAIAARLSGDRKMQAGYSTGDPYINFAIEAGLAPQGATKATHGEVRNQCKAVVLGINYGKGEKALADDIGGPVLGARQLLRAHAQTYRTFWEWSQAVKDHAVLHGYLDTVFGWRVQLDTEANPRSLQNFPMQANGAEMLRLALIIANEEGLEICAPVHDAILIESATETIGQDVKQLQEIMREAGRYVLSGFDVGSDVKQIGYPNRYMDKRGERMWKTVKKLLDLEQKESAGPISNLHGSHIKSASHPCTFDIPGPLY